MAAAATVAIVTGANRGIGAAIARRLARSGMAVGLLARGEAGLAAVAADVRTAGGTCVAVPCDVTRRDSVDAALGAVHTQLGVPTVLVNNAGVGGPFHRTDEVSDDEWESIFATNVRSAFWFCRALLPGMKQRGFGRVVNIASVQGLAGAARSSTYVASKHALVGYTKAVAAEWGPHGVTCNAICAGYVDTAMGVQPDQVEGHAAAVLRRIPARRLGTPGEVAAFVDFLAGAEGAYFNGAALVMDGGMVADIGVS